MTSENSDLLFICSNGSVGYSSLHIVCRIRTNELVVLIMVRNFKTIMDCCTNHDLFLFVFFCLLD